MTSSSSGDLAAAGRLAGRVRGVLRRMFRSLGERSYRRYVAGHAVSVIGTWMQRVGQDWLVLQLTHSGVALGTTLALQFLPVLVGGVWGGVVVDRVDKRRLIMATQAAQAVLAAVLAVLTLTDTVTLGLVYLMAFLLGCVSVFDVPARQSFVSEMVEGDDVVNALALASLVHNTGRLVGPAVGGLVIAWTGVGVTFAVNAVSFVAVLIGLAIIDPASLRREAPVPRAPGQARAGLRYVWRHPELRAIMLLVAFVAVFGQNFRVVLPLIAADTFHGDSRTYGLLTAMLGLGAVLGALLSAASTRPSARGLVTAAVVFGVANLAAALAPTLTVVMAVMVVVGAANIVFNTLARTLLQIRSERSLHGRVMAIHSLVFLGSTPIGAPLLGAVCSWGGARLGFVVAAVFSLAPAALLPLLARRRAAERTEAEVAA
jgi:predicted MFS family arabinose efflux permease